jgi:PAS domain S-box-containing protein
VRLGQEEFLENATYTVKDSGSLQPSVFSRYAVPLAVTALALLLTLFVEPFTHHSPYVLALAAIAVAVWYGGLGPGLLSTIVSTIVIWYFLLAPRLPFATTTTEDGLRLATFVLAALLINALHEIRYRKQQDFRKLSDVLELKVAERTAELEAKTIALRDSEQRFRLLVESVQDYAIYLLDPEGRIVSWNKGAERIKGYRAEEVLGRHYSVFYLPEDTEKGKPEQTLRTAAQVGRYQSEGWRRRKDGSAFWASVVITAIHDETGRLRGFAKITRDITERKNAEEALAAQATDLARSNADLERFAYVASHDLQEPLRMVASYVELLARRYKGKLDRDADDFIGYAVDGARRMQHLVHDLLEYAKLGAAKKILHRTNCETVFQQAMMNLQEALVEAGAIVTHDPLPMVKGNEFQLVQLFQNIIGNAIKFHGPQPPRIHVSAKHQGASTPDGPDYWLLSIQDNGIGIDPEDAQRIFEIFQRVHDRGMYAGTGIGLAVCKKIVESHGGRIWVDSQTGHGSTFYFTILDGQ